MPPSTTNDMSLKIPTVGETDYPTSISDSFTLIDDHDHSSGKGVQIPTGGIANSAITRAKLAALGQQVSSSCGSFSTSSLTYVDVTNLSVAITTTGRPVFIGLIADGAGLAGFGATSGSAVADLSAKFAILEGATILAEHLVESLLNAASGFSLFMPSSVLWTIRPVAAGTYTYKIQALSSTATAVINNSKLIAYEIG